MEIKNVTNKVENEYPKMKQVSKKCLSNSIPSKWLKVGLSSLGIIMIMKNNAFAYGTISSEMAGGVPARRQIAIKIPLPIIKICKNVSSPIVQMVSVIIFLLMGLYILISKLNSKKHSETKKVKKWVKILFVISIIAFILSIIAKFILYCSNWTEIILIN